MAPSLWWIRVSAPSKWRQRGVAFAYALLQGACAASDKTTVTDPFNAPSAAAQDAARIAAARTTAERLTGLCADIQPFYWEIGDKTALRTSGAVSKVGNAITYGAQTVMPIASASKWIYGAYVAERRAGVLTAEDIRFLSFRSGYTNFTNTGCDILDNVDSCVLRSTNGALSPTNIDKFYYDGGHMQKHASLPSPGMGLGIMANSALATEVRRMLGNELGLSYTQPQLAGGVRINASDYAVFLRKILNGQLQIAALLGTSATCTNPVTCPSARYTPIIGGANWHYSIGHWVEDDPISGDAAFSSAGAFGFYPWINANKTLYGIIARVDAAAGAGNASAQCGALIRKAWETAVAQ